VSGPSGVGKGSLVSAYIEKHPETFLSISLTTRSPREAERNGVEYYFVSQEEFKDHIQRGDFLEWACVFGDYYGTLRQPLEEARKEGRDIILEIDVQGGLKVKNSSMDPVMIFVLPPSLEELQRRLQGRGTENADQIDHRLQVALLELRSLKQYDYFVINDSLEKAVDILEKIICAEKYRVLRNPQLIEEGESLNALP